MSSAGRRRARVFLIELGLFMVLTFWLTSGMLDQQPGDTAWEHARAILRTTLAVITGPMTGAIARPTGFLSGSQEFSLSLVPACGAILVTGIVLQLLPLPSRPALAWVRTAAWAIGWFGWFGGGIISLLYVLE